MGKGEIKYATYERSKNLIIVRFQKILSKVIAILQEAESDPLTQVQVWSLSSYQNELRKKREDFKLNFQRIIEHGSDEDVTEATLADHMDEINDLYMSIISQIKSALPVQDDPRTPASDSNVSFQHMPTTQHVRLPQLDLKTFNGDVSQWVAYINLFDTTVHQNPTLLCT